MESCQAHYGPDAEEADDTNYDAGRGPADSIKKLSLITTTLGEQDEVCEGTDEDEDAVESKGHQEQVEISVVALTHTVTNPGAVVVKPLDTVVADGAVGGPRGAKYLAGEAVLQFH